MNHRQVRSIQYLKVVGIISELFMLANSSDEIRLTRNVLALELECQTALALANIASCTTSFSSNYQHGSVQSRNSAIS